MKFGIIGGAGFIGRWVVKNLLDKGEEVMVLDNLFWGEEQIDNIKEFEDHPKFTFQRGDITNVEDVQSFFDKGMDMCIHLASYNVVQKSLDNPEHAFETDIRGTFNILEECRKHKTKLLFMSTCMVYEMAGDAAISETHPVRPLSPYAAAKLAAENLVISYHHGYGMDTCVLRPFNTYGPYGLYPTGEASVIPLFLKRFLDGEDLNIFGDGEQTRDFLYVEDTAEFVVRASMSDKLSGQILNAGSGTEITINELAKTIQPDESKIKHIEHHHPQSDVRRLLCDSTKAKEILEFEATINLAEGIQRTKDWIAKEKVVLQ